ncbi:MAG TPA: hypothetical protein DCX54_11590 [Flavobacteriales bacterium]|nr:hypothetical protein [Flavobacteriales bacterium]
MKLRTILIDDENKAIQVLRNILERFSDDIEIVATANSVTTGLEVIARHEFDILFLDIEMQDGSGFTLLRQLPEIPFEVVFTTAFNQYALQAFKVNAIDYLLKPINADELFESIRRVQKRRIINGKNDRARLTSLLNEQKVSKLAVKERGKITFIEISDLSYIKADGVYSEIYCKNGQKYVTSCNLGHYERLIEEDGFKRIHRSYLVNLSEIKEYLTTDHLVVLHNGTFLPVSKPMRKEINNLISK